MLKKREKKEEKGLRNEEKLQEIKKKREKQRRMEHFCRKMKISEKKLARLMRAERASLEFVVRRWATDFKKKNFATKTQRH